jgi:hypothetical protein
MNHKYLITLTLLVVGCFSLVSLAVEFSVQECATLTISFKGDGFTPNKNYSRGPNLSMWYTPCEENSKFPISFETTYNVEGLGEYQKKARIGSRVRLGPAGTLTNWVDFKIESRAPKIECNVRRDAVQGQKVPEFHYTTGCKVIQK